MPTVGFQAIVLCGPGESLQPFTSNPDDLPKALVPIANRPMVWYALDWCHRTGIADITLVTPPSSASALEAALSTNPHLTALPAPRPTVLAPKHLTNTTGTAELFRLDEVQDAITGDYVILPCDLLCDMSGLGLLDSWFTLQGGFSRDSAQEEKLGRRGGLGVWYHTRDSAEGGIGVKKEETDFLATVDLSRPVVPSVATSLRPEVGRVVLTMPTATLKDKLEEDKGLRIRHAALVKHGKTRLKMTSRDAHLYIMPHWTKDFMKRIESFESIGEDVMGWWAKAGWQFGLGKKLSLDQSIGRSRRRNSRRMSKVSGVETNGDFVDLAALSSTNVGKHSVRNAIEARSQSNGEAFASRVPAFIEGPEALSSFPPLLAYAHPAQPAASVLRRVDTVSLLLSASIFLAKFPPATESQSPFAYENKIHPSSQPASNVRLTLEEATVLVDANVTFTSKSQIRESVIGTGCTLGTPHAALEGATTQEVIRSAPAGIKVQRCLLMEGASIQAGTELKGCVVGRRCKIGSDCNLIDCYVQDGYVVADGTAAKGEVLAGFGEGLDSDIDVDAKDGHVDGDASSTD